MKKVFEFLFRFLTGKENPFLVIRGFLCLTGALLLLRRPALSLAFCAFLLALFSCGAAAALYMKLPPKVKHAAWLIPAGTGILLLQPFRDTAAMWNIAFIALWTAVSKGTCNALSERLLALGCGTAGVLLIFRSFTADWFTMAPAGALILAGISLWEFGSLSLKRAGNS